METKLRSEERKQYVLAKALYLGLQALESVDNLMHKEPSDIHDIKIAIKEIGLDHWIPIISNTYTKAKAILDWSELDKEIEERMKQREQEKMKQHLFFPSPPYPDEVKDVT